MSLQIYGNYIWCFPAVWVTSVFSSFDTRHRAGSPFGLCSTWRKESHVQLGGEQRAGLSHHLPADLSAQPDNTVSQTQTLLKLCVCSWIYCTISKNINPLRFETCCTNPAVSSDAGGSEVRYSCPLTDVDPERLQLKLQPTHNTKTFMVHKHSEYTEHWGGVKRKSLCSYLSIPA